jgi:Uma2 family endonuclease
MSITAQKLVTAEEFFHMPDPPDGSMQELVKGVVVTMPRPGFQHGVCQLRVATIIDHFVRAQNLGRVTVESGCRTDRGPDSVRGPEVAFWSADRLPLAEEPTGYPEMAADFCVEIRSPHDRMSDLRKKVREYLENGVRMVWIVEPEDQTVTVYRRPGEGRAFSDDAVITGEDVLPGFSCSVADFFK